MILLKLLLFLLFFLLGLLVFVFVVIISSPIKGQAWLDHNQLRFKGHYLFSTLKVSYDQGDLQFKFLFWKFKSANKSKSEDDDEASDDKNPEKEKKKKKSKAKKKRGLPSREVIYLSLKFIKKLIRKISPKQLELSVDLGLDDPYDTGLACLVNQVLVYPLNRVKTYKIRFNPVYDDLVLDANGYGQIKFSLLGLALPILSFLLKKPIRRYLGWGFKKPKKLKPVDSKL